MPIFELLQTEYKIDTYIFGSGQKPVLGGRGVGDGFLCSERLGGNDEEHGLGVYFLQDFGEVSAVDVRDEVQVQACVIRFERFGDHQWSEIGTSDADVYYIGYALSGIPT